MTAPYALSLSFDGGDPPATLRDMAALADSGGLKNVWIACHLFHREPIACAAAALGSTNRAGVVLMAMSPYTVHPAYAAMAAATLDEYFPGRVQLCFGVGAPRGTPADVIDKLNKDINAVGGEPAIREKLVALGTEPELMTPTQFGKLIVDATEKWAKVIKFANIKPE